MGMFPLWGSDQNFRKGSLVPGYEEQFMFLYLPLFLGFLIFYDLNFS